MSTNIKNYWTKYGVAANWAWHKAHGLRGGTDYKTPLGLKIKSASDGRAFVIADGLNTVQVVLSNGIAINYRELASRTGKFPRNVKQNETIGVSGRLGTQFLHLDAFVHGIRVPFETVVSPVTSVAGVIKGIVKPPANLQEDVMKLFDTINAANKVQTYYTFDGLTLIPVDKEDIAAMKLALGKSQRLTHAEAESIRKQGAKHKAADA